MDCANSLEKVEKGEGGSSQKRPPAFQIGKSWKVFLQNQTLFWKRLTNGHSGWNDLVDFVDFNNLLALREHFLRMEEDLTLKEGIHPIFCAISLDNMDTFKELTKIYPQFQDLKISTFKNEFLSSLYIL